MHACTWLIYWLPDCAAAAQSSSAYIATGAAFEVMPDSTVATAIKSTGPLSPWSLALIVWLATTSAHDSSGPSRPSAARPAAAGLSLKACGTSDVLTPGCLNSKCLTPANTV